MLSSTQAPKPLIAKIGPATLRPELCPQPVEQWAHVLLGEMLVLLPGWSKTIAKRPSGFPSMHDKFAGALPVHQNHQLRANAHQPSFLWQPGHLASAQAPPPAHL